MTARVLLVSGARLSEFLRHPPDGVTRVEVTSPPASWAPVKPLLLQFARAYRARGVEPPAFRGVPLCLFGSEWPGFRSSAPTAPAPGRCAPCLARQSCGFGAEVPEELLAISQAPLLERWQEYGAAFRRVTGSDAVIACAPFVEQIASAYRGSVSLEPSVLVSAERSTVVDPAARFVVFPHRGPAGVAGEQQYRDVLVCVRRLLTATGSNRAEALLDALAGLAPLPVPLGMEGVPGSWRIKVYLRVEERTVAEKQAVLEALVRIAPQMDPVSLPGLQMVGLVLDADGLHTVKAYVMGRPTIRETDAFPPALPADHPLVTLAGDQALATLDIWRREARRTNKWDFNLRNHYLAGPPAERLVARLASEYGAMGLRPLLVGATYRADIVAVGVRASTLALYMELN